VDANELKPFAPRSIWCLAYCNTSKSCDKMYQKAAFYSSNSFK